MNSHLSRQIANTPLQVTQLGMGGASLGDMHATIPEAQASTTIEAAHAAGIGYFDTSPWCGNTKSELRLGHVLRDSFVISTKVERVHSRPADPDNYRHPAWKGGLPFEPRFDYSHNAILKSYEMSLARLGLNRVEALLIHDLDPGHQGSEEAVTAALDTLSGGGFRALADLKASGEIMAIGAGVNLTGMIPRFLERFPIDFFLVAMPYTLMDQHGLAELDLCQERGVFVVIGAPFASDILAVGPQLGATFGYRTARDSVMEKAAAIQAVCARHGVPMGAAALQFPFGHPSVASIIPGPVSPEQVRINLAWMRTEVPADLWAELKTEGLIAPEAPVPE